MYKIALLGRDIGYTKSPEVHAAIADCVKSQIRFDVVDVPYDRLGATVNRLLAEYDGFFVTKPYKSEIKRFIDSDLPSVNVVRSKDKAAFNTDGKGFIRALDRNFEEWKTNVKSALVLGTGGAAHSVVSALTEMNVKTYVLGRTVMNAVRLAAMYDGAELYYNQAAQLIVNCTPLGRNGEDVLRALCVPPMFEYAFDLTYSDGLTPFLRRVQSCGGKIADGTDILIYQAIEGDKILLNENFDEREAYKKALAVLRRQD